MAFLSGGDVKLLDPLRDPLAKVNKRAQGGLEDALGRLGSRQKASAKASGRPSGEYAPNELNRAGSMASRGIEDVLFGALGGASYDELRAQKEHERNLALAREIGDLSAPSLLEQVLGGLGGGSRAALQFSQLYGAANRPKPGRGRIPQDYYEDDFSGVL